MLAAPPRCCHKCIKLLTASLVTLPSGVASESCAGCIANSAACTRDSGTWRRKRSIVTCAANCASAISCWSRWIENVLSRVFFRAVFRIASQRLSMKELVSCHISGCRRKRSAAIKCDTSNASTETGASSSPIPEEARLLLDSESNDFLETECCKSGVGVPTAASSLFRSRSSFSSSWDFFQRQEHRPRA
eukprot:Skav219255  [mRNA]  locus=scaffold1242:347863:352146:- [translate_table: standard]